MAEPNPQPEAEVAASAPPPKGGGIMGPIMAAIIVVAGIAGIFNFMVVPALDPAKKEVSKELGDDANNKGEGGNGEPSHHGDGAVSYTHLTLPTILLV